MGIALLVIAIILTILAALGLLGAKGSEYPGRVRAGAAAMIVLAVVFVLVACTSRVDARSVGIETSAGKYVGTLHGGWHTTAPWAHIDQWTTRNQTLRFEGTADGGDKANYVTQPQVQVRLGNQSIAYVEATITWTVGDNTAGIESLWKQYKGFDDMRHDFVTPTVKGATNTAFDGYDPFASITVNTADPTNGTTYVPLTTWTSKLTTALRPLFEDRGLKLIGAQVTQVHYDPVTESKLVAFAQAVADTRIAGQKAETAKKEAEATAARNDKSKIIPGCEALLRDLAAQDQLKNLPAGWQCPGTTGPAVVGSR
jgi:hypothetical protein